MGIKPLVSSILLAIALTLSLPNQKANAGIAITSSALVAEVVLLPYGGGGKAEYGIIIGSAVVPVGVATITIGAIMMLFNPTSGTVLIILGEDGALSKTDLEGALAQKYSFIQDSAVTSELASMIVSKAEGQTPIDGKIPVSLTENEIRTVLEHTDLLETQSSLVQSMMNDLM